MKQIYERGHIIMSGIILALGLSPMQIDIVLIGLLVLILIIAWPKIQNRQKKGLEMKKRGAEKTLSSLIRDIVGSSAFSALLKRAVQTDEFIQSIADRVAKVPAIAEGLRQYTADLLECGLYERAAKNIAKWEKMLQLDQIIQKLAEVLVKVNKLEESVKKQERTIANLSRYVKAAAKPASLYVEAIDPPKGAKAEEEIAAASEEKAEEPALRPLCPTLECQGVTDVPLSLVVSDNCPICGFSLFINCPVCGEAHFYGDQYCENDDCGCLLNEEGGLVPNRKCSQCKCDLEENEVKCAICGTDNPIACDEEKTAAESIGPEYPAAEADKAPLGIPCTKCPAVVPYGEKACSKCGAEIDVETSERAELAYLTDLLNRSIPVDDHISDRFVTLNMKYPPK